MSKRIVLEAEEGKYYTDGLDFYSVIYLATSASKEDYRLVTEVEKQKLLEEMGANEDVLY